MKFIFFFLAVASLIFAILVVRVGHLFYATLALAAFLLCIAGFYILLFSELLGIIQIIVYIGAVVVLILFLLMITGYRKEEVPLKEGKRRNIFGAIIISVLFGSTLIFTFQKTLPTFDVSDKSISNKDLAMLLMTEWILPFELISILLLCALVGALALIRKRQ